MSTGFVMKPDFKEITSTSFRSTAQNLDFSKTVESSQIINSWCEEKTNQRIKNVIQPGLKLLLFMMIN